MESPPFDNQPDNAVSLAEKLKSGRSAILRMGGWGWEQCLRGGDACRVRQERAALQVHARSRRISKSTINSEAL